MIELDIPGGGHLELQHLVLDVNGTLALDGFLLAGVAERLHGLGGKLSIHLLTADTHGRQAEIDQQLHLQAMRLHPGDEARQKREYVQNLESAHVAAIGQGANDAGMLQVSALGICVLSKEGTAVETLLAADLVAPDILTALDLLDNPLRIIASLRK